MYVDFYLSVAGNERRFSIYFFFGQKIESGKSSGADVQFIGKIASGDMYQNIVCGWKWGNL